MGQFIIKIKDRYFIWSTVVDAPVTGGMDQSQLFRYYRTRHGEEGLRDLPERLRRVEEKGTSSRVDSSLAECIRNNRAGEKETHLTANQIYAKYGVEDHGDPLTVEDKLREALSLALQYVPPTGKTPDQQREISRIYQLIHEAT